MANEKHVELIEQGIEIWNLWRERNPQSLPQLDRMNFVGLTFPNANLSEANLYNTDFNSADLNSADFRESNLCLAIFVDADVHRTNFYKAKLHRANLEGANLFEADFCEADLSEANFANSDLRNANFTNANLTGTNFRSAKLGGANFDGAVTLGTTFIDNDLSEVLKLETIRHYGPSLLGIETILTSQDNLPDAFLSGCGIPADHIPYLRALSIQPIQFYSCFISYNHKDEEFAKRLHSRMRDANLRVWFAPEDVKGGEKLHEQIDRAIQIHDRLLIVLSEDSMKSEWVITEIRRARKVEIKEERRKLFPIRLVDFEAIQEWECFDADTGKDLAVEVREYFIPDFSNWKDYNAFESTFDKLLRDLRSADER